MREPGDADIELELGLSSHRPWRILQVSTADSLGGAESVAWDLFQAYQTRGHQAWLAVGRKQTEDPDVFSLSRRRHPNLWTSGFERLDRQLESFEHVRGIWRLRSLLRILANPRREVNRELGIENFHFLSTRQLLALTPHRPDLLHCHNLHGDYFDLRALPRLSRQIPVVLTLHDTWLLTGHCAHFLDCQRWRSGCGRCPDLDTYPPVKRDATAYNWRRKRTIYGKSRLYLTAPSKWLMDRVEESMVSAALCRVIPNGIDLTNFQPGSRTQARHELGLPQEAKIVLMIAHNEFKGYEMMQEAVARAQAADNSQLLFVCLGKEGVEKVVGQGRMLFRGTERDARRMALYYRAADLYIHAAKAEVFGKTVTEAMACAIPVVATAVGGVPEQIEDGHTGFLVPPGDSLAMASAIQRLLDDPELCSSIGLAGSKTAAARYGLERQADAFLIWYAEVRGDWIEANGG